MTFRGSVDTITLAGHVISVDIASRSFTLRCRSSDIVNVFVGQTTTYEVLKNVDDICRDRTVPRGNSEQSSDSVVANLRRYVDPDALVFVRGIHQEFGDTERMEARIVYLLRSSPGMPYVFEETQWWLTQTSVLIDRWLDELFDARRNYTVEDYTRLYRTNLSITGQPTDDNIQECATLSRLIYGLSSAFLLTGADRYFHAARAAVSYQRQAFRSLSSDGRHCFWAYGRRKTALGDKSVEKLIFASEKDGDTIPLYEQIYALAGLAQYYRITADREVLEDIWRTINAFNDFFRDDGDPAKLWSSGHGGYFSHLDPITMRPDSEALGDNRLRKNWNSIGDHIPAYLVNLVLALDPLPHGVGKTGLSEFRDSAVSMLETLLTLIIEKFRDDTSDYVNERFHADWTPDHEYDWQQDRAIVGHNLKIAWNLTRCAFYLDSRARRLLEHGQRDQAQHLQQRADDCRAVATRLGDTMANLGIDGLRGGVFDAVQRHPTNGMPVEFAWGSTKDFWQQEQGILAYLVLYGSTHKPLYLELARECMAFWNLFFLDRDRKGIYFRTTEGGLPYIEGIYGQKGGHSHSGYHVFELNFLAHIYQRTHIDQEGGGDRSFCLYFRVLSNREQSSINVLPDFMPEGRLEIRRIMVNGIDRTFELKPENADDFQLRIDDVKGSPDDGSIDLTVEFAVHPE